MHETLDGARMVTLSLMAYFSSPAIGVANDYGDIASSPHEGERCIGHSATSTELRSTLEV